ncbi:Fanconi anemia core complex-associated 100 isoform X1 [Pelobates cultripes]|uniref:Fanconi anemia core complex-associated 100 isoform X1 n=1 Tax=Pelobates cultripes TaxID=61616 RepID=A0AAD1S527_PELCU|nr:Fanconi anemia core complex-associated 100 isoform X1 [Pelobates cultripes]
MSSADHNNTALALALTAGTMSSVRYLAALQRPAHGPASDQAQVIRWERAVYVSNGTRFVSLYDMKTRRVMAVHLFPAKVWHIELVLSTRQIYVLCAKNGIYFIDLDEEGRCLKEHDHPTSVGNVKILSVGMESCCLCDPSICAFTVAHGIVVTASKHPENWGIKLFHCSDKPASVTPFREMKFSIKPPPGAIKELKDSGVHPLLQCVTLWKENESSDNCSLKLQPSLFTAVLGLDCALLESPVILCGFPDGQVVCFPLNAAGLPRSGNSGTPLECVRVLYHLEQPVVFIGATRLELQSSESAHSSMSNGTLASDCLLFIGCGGLLVTLTQLNNTQGTTCEFREYRLQAPVSCALCCGSNVYYSTCSDLLSVTIPPLAKMDSTRTQHNPIMPSVSHSVTMVVAIALTSCSPDGDVELVAVSNRGKLLLCKLNRKQSKAQVGLLGSRSGKQIKALLSGIGTVSDRVSKLRSILDQKTRCLMALNQVSSLIRLILTASPAECPVHCQVKVSWTNIVGTNCFVAACKLKNNTDCVLEKGWTLCVSLWRDSCDNRTSYSFPLPKLLPGEYTELCFPLSIQSSRDFEFPINMACTLFYSFKDISTDNEPSVSPTDLFNIHKQGICVPLQDLSIDILQCLRLNPRAGHPFSPVTSPWDVVESFLKMSNRIKRNMGELSHITEDVGNPRVNVTVSLKVTVRVSAHLFSQVLQNRKSGESVCSSVLRWLFPDKLTSAENKEEVHAVTPSGRELFLRVREVSVGESSTAIPAIEVEIGSPHLDALACMHMAVISRFGTLVQRNKSNGCHTPDLKLRNIQQQFLVKESSLKEVQATRDRLCVLKGLNSAPILQKLLHIYRVLRDPGPLIF